MGLINQGWFIRCDECDQADHGCIGCRDQRQTIADARRAGWVRMGLRWFCSEQCRSDWKQARALGVK